MKAIINKPNIIMVTQGGKDKETVFERIKAYKKIELKMNLFHSLIRHYNLNRWYVKKVKEKHQIEQK